MTEKTTEYSKPFYLREAVGPQTIRTLTLSEKEKQILEERFDFQSLEGFEARFMIIKSEDDKFFDVRFNIKGKATILSSFDDEPVEIDVDEDENEYFTTDKELAGDEGDDFNAPQFIGKENMIDLGELASDYFFLMVDEKYRSYIFEKMRLNAEEAEKEAAEELEKAGIKAEIAAKQEDTHRPFANLKQMIEERK